MTQLRVGIIGLGVGEKHLDAYYTHPDCKVVAICDFSEEKLNMVKQKYPELRSTSDAEKILSDPGINVVSISSYDNYHYEQIVQATLSTIAKAAADGPERTALILVGQVLSAETFAESSLYAADYERRFRPRSANGDES